MDAVHRDMRCYITSFASLLISQIAKLFTNGRSQAVRLPAAFRFDSREVFVRKDPEMGDVILSKRPTPLPVLIR